MWPEYTDTERKTGEAMTRATIYCRFSTENQRETSLDDQARNCERFAGREGWQITSRFQDKAISGTKQDRAGYQAMLAAAKRREFDVLLVDDLSRLSRDEIELKQTVRRFKFAGLRIIGVSDGFDTADKGHKIQATVRGLINEIYLDDLAEKTHRGLTGKALAGFNAGGRSYGYRHCPIYEGTDEYGRPRVVAARREIDPDQACVIREIFELFIQGWSPRSIAQELNRRSVLAPRGGTWAFSAIYGDKVRSGVGILNNPLYIGRVIWNRSEWVRDPDTGKRKRKERPQSEWIVRENESLRIIPQELWDAAQRRMAASTLHGGSRGKARPKTLFGGILRCGSCGGAVVAVSAHSYGCAARRDRGDTVCQGVLVSRAKTEQLLTEDLRTDMLSPVRLSQLHADVRDLLRSRRAVLNDALAETHRRLGQVEAEIANIVAAIKAGAYSQVLQSELAKLEAERERLQAAMSVPFSQNQTLDEIPRLLERYRRMLEELNDALARRTERSRAVLAETLGEVVLVKEPDGAVWAEFEDPTHRLLLAAGGGVFPDGSGGRI
jgi:site-specific DNA recombinase